MIGDAHGLFTSKASAKTRLRDEYRLNGDELDFHPGPFKSPGAPFVAGSDAVRGIERDSRHTVADTGKPRFADGNYHAASRPQHVAPVSHARQEGGQIRAFQVQSSAICDWTRAALGDALGRADAVCRRSVENEGTMAYPAIDSGEICANHPAPRMSPLGRCGVSCAVRAELGFRTC